MVAQPDTIICRPGDPAEEFFEHSYIGGPNYEFNDSFSMEYLSSDVREGGTMNGGISLRNKARALEFLHNGVFLDNPIREMKFMFFEVF